MVHGRGAAADRRRAGAGGEDRVRPFGPVEAGGGRRPGRQRRPLGSRLCVVRRGRRRLIPVRELAHWLECSATDALQEVPRARGERSTSSPKEIRRDQPQGARAQAALALEARDLVLHVLQVVVDRLDGLRHLGGAGLELSAGRLAVCGARLGGQRVTCSVASPRTVTEIACISLATSSRLTETSTSFSW
jgi:hypothetical protein